MLLTDDAEIYKRCLKLRDHGRTISNKMYRLQAALVIAQLERSEELVQKKIYI